ncbi:hypothetical protein BEL04_23045 [Mucilaginibacter sp. PPCGB 2223]|uniref:FAD-dependent oxidoreductase n=1 Tax=Mucilaginibacter sp. PPCGB 2223 TaxID=1886027 RepID=UPI0008242958|nr:FAD-dependent oxidoreductase [Mucilaginibacter sp. PPCGB 2223]OCX50649.1 hypothetical protein BEL04_23045 [Mucilaginibacter sp. PPCGB 2223]
MVKKLFVLVLLSAYFGAHAQENIKTDVLVIGGSASGVSAGIQAARSGVQTIIVEPGPWLGGSMTSGANCIVDANRNLPSGIWGEFRRHVIKFYKNTPGYDTTANATLRFEPYTGAAILKKITDTVKRLNVKFNTQFAGIKKNGDLWDVVISEKGVKSTISARVVIDATETADVAAKAGANFDIGFDSKKTTGEPIGVDEALPLIEEVTWIAVLKDYGRAADRTIDKPEGYDPSLYSCLKGKDIKKMLADGRLPNDKYMIKWGECANSFPVTMDQLEPDQRDDFYKECRLKTLGLIYYLQTELGFKNLAPDFQEFPTKDRLPMIPYIREARRVQGQIRMVTGDIFTPYDRASKLYRTAIAVGDASPGQHYSAVSNAPKINYPPMPGYSIPLGSVIVRDMENLLVTEKAMSTTHLVNASTFYPSVQMTVGQGAGTVAAFCAFYKTTTKKINVREVQKELIRFNAYLMPFVDVKLNDPYFRSIQQIGATGLIKGVQLTKGKATATYFLPDSIVKTTEVKPVLMEIYARSFLWFNKVKPGDDFTVGNLLSFISEMTLSDPETLQKNVKKYWQSRFKFTSAYDLGKPITRREFAILANLYINPFARNVDITGRLIN